MLIPLMSVLLPHLSFAFFCPTNFNQIDFGYTIDQVTQQCGPPAKQDSRKLDAAGPQEWSYYIPQAVSDVAMQSMQGTLKTQFTFDSSGTAINISVNGIGVGSTTICSNTLIQLGDKMDRIKSLCGDPSFINKQEPSNSGTPAVQTEITEFIYTSNPPVKLTFENGKLKSKE